MHEWLCLHTMEVAKHSVRSPMANEVNDAQVDVHEQECHGTCSMEAACGHVGRKPWSDPKKMTVLWMQSIRMEAVRQMADV